jgi:autoinducer 2 (AI-2) kinase
MSGSFLAALDAGGGSGRFLLLEVESGAVTTAKKDWSHRPAPHTNGLGYDLDLDEVWRKLAEASREALAKTGARPEDVVGIAATSMRNTTVVLDASGKALFAVPNQDARALAEALTLAGEAGREVHQAGGHWPSPLFTGTRLLWMRTHAEDLLKRAHKVLSLSDWVGFRLGGGVFAEKSQAGETLLYDLEKGDWDYDLIASLALPGEIFPETVVAGTRIGGLSKEASDRLGLLEGTPIVAGGADTQCGLLGAGAVNDGDLGIIAGTTLPIQLVLDKLVLDPGARLWSGQHVVPGRYVLESNGLTAGYVLEWFAKVMYADYQKPLLALLGEAARSEPGASGVYSTLGTCIFNACTLGIPVGNLTMSHMVTSDPALGRRHISRSVLEGIAYSARANIEQIAAVIGREPTRIRVSGGLSRSPLWTQILSDVLFRELTVSSTPEVSALGAAICAGVGAGVFADHVEGAKKVSRAAREHFPGDHAGKYRTLYAGWKEAYRMRETADTYVSGLMAMHLLERTPPEEEAAGKLPEMRIMVTASLDEAALRELEVLGEVTYSPWRETLRVYDGGKELIGTLAGYNVFVTEMDVVDFEAIMNLPELRAILVCRGNPVNIDIESATAFGIPVIATPGRNADAVADLAVAFMVMLSRNLPEAIQFLKREVGKSGDLARMAEAYMKYQGKELWRKTVGIVGMGEVGSRVAQRLKPFGARVLFFDPFLTAEEGALFNAEKVSLDSLLAESDFITLHAPANERTHHLIDREAFHKMKRGAYLINTARASLVDEEALAEALESGVLAGAALDVFSAEPPAPDDPIVSRRNVIATPHIGGNTYEVAAHQGAMVADQLGKLFRGGTPEYILNPEVLESFSWSGPRREPQADELERLSRRERPRMTS